MISNLRSLRLLVVIGTVLATAGSSRVARAQQDNEPIDDDLAPPVKARAVAVRKQAGALVVRQQMTVVPIADQLERRMFARMGGTPGAQSKLDSSLLLRIEDLERTCHLTLAQKNKLQLAGRGDIKRFFDKVDDLKQQFQEAQNGLHATVNILRAIQPLQVELNAGLFGNDSLYAKTIRRTLSPEQIARFESLARERKALRFRATVDWYVTHLDKGLGLTDDQRQRFVELLVEQARPPRRFGQYDYWYLMLRTARLPEAKLKPIFDAPQWRLLSRQFAQAKMTAQRLKANGVVIDDEDDDEKTAMRDSPPGPSRPAVSERTAVQSVKP